MDQPLDIGYNYQPLNPELQEIRILWIKEQKPSKLSPLQCILQHVSLLRGPAPPYWAISYTWGDRNDRRPAFIDGQQVSIPESADSALRNCSYCGIRWGIKSLTKKIKNGFRHDWWPFWIDAVCINQSDVHERSEQVKIMGRIYSSTVLCFAWLGFDADGSAATAKQAMQKAQNYYEEYYVEKDTQTTAGPVERRKALAFTEREWAALDSLYRSPYFRRSWVIQEAVLPQRVIFQKGSCRMHRDHLFKFDQLFVRDQDVQMGIIYHFSLTADQGFFGARNIVFFFRDKTSLSKVLVLTSESAASDPRDKVYAFLGLVKDEESYGLAVDYTLSAKDVHTGACRAAIVRDRQLSVLGEAYTRVSSTTTTSRAQYPTWVIPCHRRLAGSASRTGYILGMPAKLKDLFDYADVGMEGVLRIKGIVLDGVEHICLNLSFDQQKSTSHRDDIGLAEVKAVARALRLARDAARRASQYPNEESTIRVLYQILLPEFGDFGALERETYYRFFERLASFKGVDNETCSDIQEILEVMNRRQIDRLDQLMRVNNGGRLLVTTSQGRLATAWPTVKKGDKICLMFGSDNLLVMREENEHWLLIGDAMVQDMTTGDDLLQLYEREGLESKIQWFDIH